MNKRLKYLLATAVVVVIALGTTFYFVGGEEPEIAGKQPSPTAATQTPVSSQGQQAASGSASQSGGTTNTPSQPSKGPPPAQTVSVDSCSQYVSDACRKALQDKAFALQVIQKQVADNPRARSYMRAIKMQMRPFTFEGQIVDRDGNSMRDVDIVYRLGFPYSLGYTETATVTTDDKGRFQLRGRAYSLVIRNLEKPGYTPAPGFSRNREFGWQQRRGYKSWKQATAQSPQQFVMMPGRP